MCVRENCDVLNTSKIELIVARVTLKIGAEFPKKHRANRFRVIVVTLKMASYLFDTIKEEFSACAHH